MIALVSPNEKVIDCNGNVGCRIAQVEQVAFEVAPPLFWNACPDKCIADLWYFIESECFPLPAEPV